MKLKASKLALVWDELKNLSREDDLDLGGLTWCDVRFVFGMHIEIEEDVFINCQDGCQRFSTENCFLD